jgi:hypothetical protein
MNQVRRALATIAALSIALLALAGCGSHRDIGYAPDAYGESGHCYYVDDPSEVATLIATGHCPSSWTAAPMPTYWHARYSTYYDSTDYYNTYVPAPRRAVYVTHVTTFEKVHAADITRQAPSATYKGTDGKKYTGTQAAAGRYGGGARSGGGGGGSRTGGYSGGTARSSNGGSKPSGSYGGSGGSTYRSGRK